MGHPHALTVTLAVTTDGEPPRELSLSELNYRIGTGIWQLNVIQGKARPLTRSELAIVKLSQDEQALQDAPRPPLEEAIDTLATLSREAGLELTHMRQLAHVVHLLRTLEKGEAPTTPATPAASPAHDVMAMAYPETPERMEVAR